MMTVIKIVLLSDLVSISLHILEYRNGQKTPKFENQSSYSPKGFYACLWCFLDLCKVKVTAKNCETVFCITWEHFSIMCNMAGCNKNNRCILSGQNIPQSP